MIKSKIRKFFQTDSDFSSRLPKALKDADSLINSGIIDSLGVVKLILFIEESFRIVIRPEELTESNFETINSIELFIKRKVEAGQSEESG